MVNAWDEDGAIIIDICASNASQFAPKLDGTLAEDSEGVNPTLRRWRIDVSGKTDTVTEELIDDLVCEFPRTDDRYMTRQHRHAYAVGGLNYKLEFNRLFHWDSQSGSRKAWGEDRYLLGEPVLAPRSESADEGDGHLLVLGYDQETSLSEMMIFDAADIEQGPVAKAKLPVRIPAGFHGSWVGA